jgi:hypothetical protein
MFEEMLDWAVASTSAVGSRRSSLLASGRAFTVLSNVATQLDPMTNTIFKG